MMTGPVPDWKQTIASLGPVFADRAAAYDGTDTFVAENYAEMRATNYFRRLYRKNVAAVFHYREVCGLIRDFGRVCGSTALAFSMHQHLVAAALWNYRHGKPGEILLRAVADGEKVLVSTGATDWLSSSGVLERLRRRIPVYGQEAVRERLRCRRSPRHERPVQRSCRGPPSPPFLCFDGRRGSSHRPRLGDDGDAGYGIAYGHPRQCLRPRAGDYAAATLRPVSPYLECDSYGRDSH